MYVETLKDASAFQTLQTEWLQLLSRMSFQSAFLTPQWQETWWRHFAADRQLHLVTVRSEDGVLRGCAPLMRSPAMEATARLKFVGDLEVCDYFDLLVDPAYEDEVATALIPMLLQPDGEDVALCLQNLSAASRTPALLRRNLEAHGLTVTIDEIETCPTITLPDNWNDYLALLRGKDRHELRRKIRRAEATVRIEYAITHDTETLAENLETFFALHRMSQQDDKREFMTEDKAAFFRDMAQQMWHAGWFDLIVLFADGVAVAALCSLPYGTTYAAYNAGYHPDYAHLSAGILLFANRIQAAIAQRCSAFDFLRGNESYKYRFGASDQPLSRLLARTACSVSGSCS
jgi:CelD/BcsL family acetyltransferase involved in cellulose biosynthesis